MMDIKITQDFIFFKSIDFANICYFTNLQVAIKVEL